MRGIRAAAFAMGVLAAGCSVILSTAEPTQCTTDDDCGANPAFAGRTCESGFCVLPHPPGRGPDTPETGAGCVDDTGCTARNSGKASRCAKSGGACTPLQTEQCAFLSGKDAWKDPDALLIGAILPLTVKQVGHQALPYPYAERLKKAIDLGVDEVNVAFPGGVGLADGKHHPVAVLVCDSGLDAKLAGDAFVHLVDTVHVSALIIGADEDLAAVTPKALSKQTAIICSDCIGPFPPVPQAWRVVPPLAQQVPMASWRVEALEAQRKAEPGAPASVRVALLTQKSSGPAAFATRFIETAQFNGKSVKDNGADFLVVSSEDARTESPLPSVHAAEIRNFAPDIIVVAMGQDFPNLYAGLIEDQWPAGTRRPYYVVTDLSYDVSSFTSILGVGTDALRNRISGTRHAFDPALQAGIDGFTTRWSIVNSNHQPPGGNWSAYEAFYELLYAINAGSLGAPVLDGPHISNGFGRLRSGATTDVGPGQLGFGFAALGQPNGSINLRGLWSNLDWNLTTHDLEGDVGMFCFTQTDGELFIKDDAGPRLPVGATAVTGVYACD